MDALTIFTLSAITAVLGTLGGIGGATILVPVLVIGGLAPIEAAPLGLLSVAAGSLAAAARQARAGLVHHRLGVVIEIAASAGGAAGALVAGALSATVLSIVLGVAAIASAAAGGSRTGMRNLPDATFCEETPGEWPGTLSGQYVSDVGVVPYQASRVPMGMALASLAGLVSGLSGVGGGFIKVPTMSEVMRVPVKVAAATSTFTIGITAAVGLSIYAIEDRIELASVGPVVAGGLLGGVIGARLQHRLSPVRARQMTSVMLALIGVVVIVRAFW